MELRPGSWASSTTRGRGTLLCVDPGQEIVGVYFSIELGMTPAFEPLWNADLFKNVIASAVED